MERETRQLGTNMEPEHFWDLFSTKAFAKNLQPNEVLMPIIRFRLHTCRLHCDGETSNKPTVNNTQAVCNIHAACNMQIV
jgi:hypothetical protein